MRDLIQSVQDKHKLTQEELAKKLKVNRAWIVRATETRAIKVYKKLLEMNK